MATAGEHLEVEWQFNAVDVRPVARWLASAAIEGYTTEPRDSRRLNDAYFDTDDWRVHRAGFTCRLRWEGARGELTLKSMADPVDDIRRREEITQRVTGPVPLKFLEEAGPATDLLAPLVGTRTLTLLFALETERQRYTLADGAGVIGEIALDTTTIPVGSEDHPVRMSRVEVEVDAAAVDRARRFVDVLVASTALTRAGASKFEAALLASGREPPAGVPYLGPTDLDPSMTVSGLAFAVMRQNFAQLLRNEPGTRLGRDPEALHDMRVATRRIRAALSTFRTHLSPTAGAAAGEIAWLTRLLGPVRDLDVQIERLEARMAEPGVDTAALAGYRDVLAQRRTVARKRLLAGLDSRRYERAVRRWTALLTRGPARTFVPGRMPAIEAVPPLVERRYRRLRKHADAIRPDSEPTAYHIARIEAKKLRYAAEFGAPLYGERATAFVESVKALQDVLGEHQDATVAMETLAAEAGNRRLGPRTVLAMGALAEHYRTEAERLRSAFPASYRAVKGVRWKRFRRQMARRASRSPGKAPVVAPRRTRAARPGRRGGDTAQIDKARPTG